MVSRYALTDLNRMRDIAGLVGRYPSTNTTVLEEAINGWSRSIHDFCNRRWFRYRTTTEYYQGSGTEKLRLKDYPIISVSNVYEDLNRSYGADTEIASDYLEVQEEAGIIARTDGFKFNKQPWTTLKVVYVSGYSDFEIMTGLNGTLSISDSGGSSDVALDSGSYNISTLCTELQSKLNNDSTLAGTYTVSYSESGARVSVSCDKTFSTDYSTYTELPELIGWDTANDESSISSKTGDYPIRGLPSPLVSVADELTLWTYTAIEEDRIGVTAEAGDLARSYDYHNIPRQLERRLEHYKLVR